MKPSSQRPAHRRAHSVSWRPGLWNAASLVVAIAMTSSIAGCGDDDESSADTGADAADVGSDVDQNATLDVNYATPGELGPYGVGNTTRSWTDADREGRLVVTEIWYPTEATASGEAIVEFYDGDDRTLFEEMFTDAPGDCMTTQTTATRDATPYVADGHEWPVIVMSHCHNCLRVNTLSVAEHLASYGFIVAAVDHADNRLFDSRRGEAVELSGEFLEVRGQDLSYVLDQVLSPASDLPTELVGTADADTVGVLGHSFGAVTVGWMLQFDDRVRAGVAVAAPLENPLIPGVDLDEIAEPTLLVLAGEDNSITEIGNTFIRNNFDELGATTYKLEVHDAGHWSFSDIAGIVDDFTPGCGDDERQTNGDAFTYLEPDEGIPILTFHATAFFGAYLLSDTDGLAALTSLQDERFEMAVRNP